VKHTKKGLVVGVAMIGAMVLSGCATKKYVDENVLRVETAGQQNTTRLGEHDARLGQLDQATREALERANAAGKLAEGKFLYSIVLSDDSVKFPVNRHELSPEAQTRLADFANRLKGENKNVYLEIQGHTDATGPANYNDQLGQARAEAVRKFMSKQGIALNRIGTISYGEEMPVAPNETPDGRAQNRRVAIVVLQ
jgi:peptidoglycan-associated lipoprotein